MVYKIIGMNMLRKFRHGNHPSSRTKSAPNHRFVSLLLLYCVYFIFLRMSAAQAEEGVVTADNGKLKVSN